MSERNTGLFVAGHLPSTAVAEALWSTPGLSASLFVGEEAVRVGHAVRQGHAYTHIGLRLFEEGGLRLMDQAALPGAEEPEQHLACVLSAAFGPAVYLFYDEEHGAGGAARFQGGRLVLREVYDARGLGPVHRSTDGTERALVGLDPSDWIWRPASETIEASAALVVGPGIRDDDDIEALIAAATPQAVPEGPLPDPLPPSSSSSLPPPTASPPPPSPPRQRRRDWVWGLLGGARTPKKG